jgi:hypothetical protein
MELLGQDYVDGITGLTKGSPAESARELGDLSPLPVAKRSKLRVAF